MSNEQNEEGVKPDETPVLHWMSEDLEDPPGDDDERAERQVEADAERKIGHETEDPWVE